MRRLILATVSVMALGLGAAGVVDAAGMNDAGDAQGSNARALSGHFQSPQNELADLRAGEIADWRAGYGVPARSSLAAVQRAQQLLQALCCTDQHPGAVSPPQRHLREANVLRPPKLEHPV